jgi:hypothetical protein
VTLMQSCSTGTMYNTGVNVTQGQGLAIGALFKHQDGKAEFLSIPGYLDYQPHCCCCLVYGVWKLVLNDIPFLELFCYNIDARLEPYLCSPVLSQGERVDRMLEGEGVVRFDQPSS